jgi:NTP pyrophosphatase (non-canonical NTP hydrolase)
MTSANDATLRTEHMSSMQMHVHEMILRVGGYWRPSAGLARLLEEMGELAEQVRENELGPLADEMADIWIITTCLANQFEVDLREWVEPQRDGILSPTDMVIDLLYEASRLARVINYYDGPKTPRALSDVSPIGLIVTRLHRILFDGATSLGVDLHEVIHRKVLHAGSRDRKRFSESFDPSTAMSALRFQKFASNSHCTYASKARIWGAPRWEAKRSIGWNVDSILPHLLSFTKATPLETLDGFVVRPIFGAKAHSMRELANGFRTLLKTLNGRDPKRSTCMAGDVSQPGWQFEFNNVRLFISVFSPIYDEMHPRRADECFIFFQSEQSFTDRKVGSQFTGSDRIKRTIRGRFQAGGFWYPADIIDERIEARIYLMPRSDRDEDSRWWEDPPGQATLFTEI